MRWWLRLFSLSLLFGLLSFACVHPDLALASEVETWESVNDAQWVALTTSSNVSSFSPFTSPIATNTPASYGSLILNGGRYSAFTYSGNRVGQTVVQVGSGSLPSGTEFRIRLNSNVTLTYIGSSSSTNYNYQCTGFTFYCVNSSGTKRAVTTTVNGTYIAPFDTKFVIAVYLLNGLNSMGDARYVTMNLVGMTVQTNSTQPTIEGYIQDQTDTLTNTDGADTVTPDVVETGTDEFENMSLIQQLGTIGSEIQQAVSSTEEDDGVLFPGLSVMGFTIPAQEVNVWDYLPSVQEEVRWITTFIFVGAFLHYLHDLADNIFGTGLPDVDGEE